MPPPVESETPVFPGDPVAWTIERHAGSEGRVQQVQEGDGTPALEFRWHLAGGMRTGQYAALVRPIDGRALAAAGVTQVAMTAAAARPMRASVQIRVPDGRGLRWQRSVYLDATPRAIAIPLREMTPIEAPPGAPLALSKADTLLVVVDTVNTVPGTSGLVRVSRVSWQRTAGRRGGS